MKRTLLVLAVAILACAQFASAQTAGTITVQGLIPEAFSLTNSSGIVLPTPTTIDLGTLQPANDQDLVEKTSVTLYLRSNKKYTLTASAGSILRGTGSADGGFNIQLSDIGFGVRSLDTTGANVVNPTTHVINDAKFDYSAWPTATGGLLGKDEFIAQNKGTLDDVKSSGAVILKGNRISNKGNISTTSNAVLLTLGFAVLPQYFSPDDTFSSAVLLTIATQ